jgi:hypothetical protein
MANARRSQSPALQLQAGEAVMRTPKFNFRDIVPT